MLWKGNQKELCELIVELQAKGWVEDIRYGEMNKTAKSICHLFDLSLTKKDESSNIENSFYQILKGKNNKKTKKREYDEVFGENYNAKFNNIKEKSS